MNYIGQGKNKMKQNMFRDMQRKYSAKRSMGFKNMYKVMNDPGIPADAGVAIEYNIPQTAKRVDFMVSGYDAGGNPGSFANNTNILNSTSKTYYILLYSYIIFIEILAIVLRRRYDTKSTVMKLFFILLYVCISVFGLDITHYQMILTVFLILISIVNTSNIYLNREERVKMLVAA